MRVTPSERALPRAVARWCVRLGAGLRSAGVPRAAGSARRRRTAVGAADPRPGAARAAQGGEVGRRGCGGGQRRWCKRRAVAGSRRRGGRRARGIRRACRPAGWSRRSRRSVGAGGEGAAVCGDRGVLAARGRVGLGARSREAGEAVSLRSASSSGGVAAGFRHFGARRAHRSPATTCPRSRIPGGHHSATASPPAKTPSPAGGARHPACSGSLTASMIPVVRWTCYDTVRSNL